jgi:hypothetical protein
MLKTLLAAVLGLFSLTANASQLVSHGFFGSSLAMDYSVLFRCLRTSEFSVGSTGLSAGTTCPNVL